MKKVLITGGKGYIARNLVPLFEKKGYEVKAPSHIELDLLNRELLEEYLLKSQPDVIIHTATKGGKRTKEDTWEDVYVPNIKMFENLYLSNTAHTKIIVIGSGAEFDRRYPIQYAIEKTVQYEWPIDPYGLSKNIITKRVLADLGNAYVLRLFGCFNFDEDPARFIKAGILNLKRGLPIGIHQNKEMDFFYLDDVFKVMDYVINEPNSPRNINLVYEKKMTLMDIASLIHKHVNLFEPTIKLVDMRWDSPYTGACDVLYSTPVSKNLVGLEEGIRQTVLKLT
jgi:UDP-glucose 4-epimerase